MFSIDGKTWPWPCKITRTSEMKASDISGMLMDMSFFNDVLGQFLSYEVAIAPPVTPQGRDAYKQVYEMLTDPVDGHTFVLPYDQGTVEIAARVSNIRDEYVRLTGGGIYWKGIRFTVTANHPTRTYTLGEVLARGRAILPEIASPAEGDTYTYHNGAWGAAQSYADADEIAY